MKVNPPGRPIAPRRGVEQRQTAPVGFSPEQAYGIQSFVYTLQKVRNRILLGPHLFQYLTAVAAEVHKCGGIGLYEKNTEG